MRIFLSYGHDANQPLVDQIKSDLESQGHDVWIDYEKIYVGQNWRDSITEGITKSDYVMAFLSTHSTRDPGVCRDELAIALSVKHGAIQTVLIESEKSVSPPVSLTHVQWLDMHEWKDFKYTDQEKYEIWYKEKLNEILRVLQDPVNQRMAGELDQLEKILKPISYISDIGDLLKNGFIGRQWLFKEIIRWAYDDWNKRLFWLTGGPGTGKSAISAMLAHGVSVDGSHINIIGTQFCKYNQPERRNPKRIIETVIYQLAARYPEYRKLIIGHPRLSEIDKMNSFELFSSLLIEPLKMVINGGRERSILVIDGIDETIEGGRSEMAELLALEANKLPDWLGIMVTGRPDPEIKRQFDGFSPVMLEPADERNLVDIRSYIENWIEEKKLALNLVDKLLELSEGNILYIVKLREASENGWIDLNNPGDLPRGLTSIYTCYFRKQFAKEDFYKKTIRPFLEIVVSAFEPPSCKLIADILEIDDYDLDDIIESLGTLFPINNNKVTVFHKSLHDWLIDPEKSGSFRVSKKKGHERWYNYLLGKLKSASPVESFKAKLSSCIDPKLISPWSSSMQILYSLMKNELHQEYLVFCRELLKDGFNSIVTLGDMANTLSLFPFNKDEQEEINKMLDTYFYESFHFAGDDIDANFLKLKIAFECALANVTTPSLFLNYCTKIFCNNKPFLKDLFTSGYASFGLVSESYASEISDICRNLLASGKIENPELIEWLQGVADADPLK